MSAIPDVHRPFGPMARDLVRRNTVARWRDERRAYHRVISGAARLAVTVFPCLGQRPPADEPVVQLECPFMPGHGCCVSQPWGLEAET